MPVLNGVKALQAVALCNTVDAHSSTQYYVNMLISLSASTCSHVVRLTLWDAVESVYMDFTCTCVDISASFSLLN